MKKYSPQQLQEFARKLKAEQDRLEPCLTYEQMLKVLGYEWDNSITRIMQRLVDAGLAKEIEFGEVGKKRYRILDAPQTHKNLKSVKDTYFPNRSLDELEGRTTKT